jgi:outer membrane biosynthesis protein TonB
VRFTIAASGEVSEATVTEQTVKDERLAACVVGVVKTSKFPKPRGGGQVVVTWPFLFKR